ncbi:SpaA isopeptide-forming pilin-related protein [Bengtsoniella intestinalis]|uniref:MSCRAMM family protein n=1 Tax=Bengtsoniella intestinalis TaxID=3073143 RepID=UPI00391F73F4
MTQIKQQSRRLMAWMLTLVLMLGLIPSMQLTALAASTEPTNVKVTFNEASDTLGSYSSPSLGYSINVRNISTTYTYDGESVTSFAMCLDHGNELSSSTVYSLDSVVSNYAAAPFYIYMLYADRNWGWDADLLKITHAWVSAAVWMAEAGVLTDPTNAIQIEKLVEERIAVQNQFWSGDGTDYEDYRDSIRSDLNSIVTNYNAGVYGDWTLYRYSPNNNAMQSLLIAEQSIESDTYPVYVQLNKTDESGSALANAEFDVYYNGAYQTTFTTNASGYGVSSEIRINETTATLTVVETKAPSGYSLSGQTYTVSVDSSTNSTAATAAWVNGGTAITNTIITVPSEYIILKTDEATGESLPGATFRLEHVTNNTTYDLVTDSSGSIQLQWLDSSADNYITPGTYTVTETVPPVGYSLSDSKVETLTFELIWNSNTNQYEQNDPGQLKYENPADNTIRFTKIDESGNVLDGGTFNVYKDGTLLGQYEGGTIVLSDLKTGYYTFEEVSPPSGYVMSSNPYASVYVDVEDTATDTYYLSMINYDYPDIQIRKSDPTGLGLSGAIFDVQIDGTPIGQVTTNSIGVAAISYAQYGAYLNDANDSWTVTITEAQAPSGYLMSNTNVITAEIQKGQSLATLEFVNDPIPEIQIAKIDSATGEPLAGAEFAVYIDGVQIGTYYSDDDGIVSLDYNDYGNHLDLTANSWVIKVIETAAPSGYSISDVTEQELTVVRGQTIASYTFGNYAYPQIEIYKSDEDTNRALAGSLFKVSIDAQTMGYYTTGSDGKILISYADYYEYLGVTTENEWVVEVEEIRAPSGYLLNADNTQTAVLNRNQGLITFSFQNEAYPEIHINKTDSNGNPLANTLFSVSVDGTEFGQFWTNNNGEIIITHDTYGDFLGDSGADSWTVTVTEVQPTTGYLLSGTTTSTQEVKRGQAVAEFTFSNYEVPEIQILKTDSSTGEPLANAEFEVFINGQSIGSFYSDADGLVLLDEANYGNTFDLSSNSWLFTVVEVNPPSGYALNYETTQSVTVTAGQITVPFNFSNYTYPEIQITKTDADTNEPLAGAIFEVAIDAQTFGTFTTDENGEIIITYDQYYEYLDRNADSWTVTVQELNAPGGYLMDGNIQNAELKRNQGLLTFSFTNAAYPSIIVEKRSSTTNELLEGATFDVTIDATYVGSFTTDSNGQFTITYDQYGGYLGNADNDGWTVYVTETQAPDGYHDAEIDTQQAQMFYGQSLTPFVFINVPRSDLLITKVDSVDESPLEGVTFEVSRDTTSIGTFKTDANGQILIEDLEIGTYTVTEVDTIYGYVLNDTPQTVEVAMDDNIFLYTLHFTNDRQPTLTVNKIDSITGDPILGALFEVTYQSSKTSTGEIRDLGTYYTDTDGQFELLALDEGWYTVTELEPADGYALAEPLTQELHLSGNENAVMTFENIPLSALVIKKVDATTGEVLQGAKFSVSYLAGTSGTGGTVIGNYETSVNGTIVITGLEAGTYIIQETQAPDGYVIDDAPETVYISGGTQDVVMVEFENQPDSGLIITKLDSSTGEPLADATFQITTDDGTVVGTGNGYYTTDATGTIHIPNLTTDTYIVTEITAPDGYVLDGTPQTVKLIYGETHNLTFYNDPTGGLVIQKLDSVTGEALSGAVFKVTTSDGTYVANYGGTVSSNGLYTTDAYGQIHIIDLDPGTYIVTEVTAPDGYILDSTSQTVRIYENDTQTLTFENTPIGGLTIIKTDEDDGDRIKGVEFEVRKMNGEIIGTYTTSSTGTICLSALDSGWYTVTETKAASGYILDTTPYNVEVTDGETATLKITNHKESNIVIRKVDADTGEGLYGAIFVLYDSNDNPIGEYMSDQRGYVYIDGVDDGRYKLREIEAPEGYIRDDEYKTIYVRYGSSSEVTWENTAILGQIQITKYSSEYNQVTGAAAGTALSGATYEITNYKSGTVVGYITTDSRGVAASDPLPLGRYIITEVAAPAYYQLSSETFDVTLEYEGQIIKLAAYNSSATLDVSITKTGISEVLAGATMSYNFAIANTSNVALDNFYWHDRIPTDVTTASTLTTGTYNQFMYYQVLYKTNYNDYRVLASNLLTTNNYSFALNTIPLMSGEVVTDICYDFGTVPAGFQSVTQPTLSVSVNPSTITGYYITNRADIGGTYQGLSITAQAYWITIAKNLYPVATLPKTGY